MIPPTTNGAWACSLHQPQQWDVSPVHAVGDDRELHTWTHYCEMRNGIWSESVYIETLRAVKARGWRGLKRFVGWWAVTVRSSAPVHAHDLPRGSSDKPGSGQHKIIRFMEGGYRVDEV